MGYFVLLSPAKTIHVPSTYDGIRMTVPTFMKQTNELMDKLKTYSRKDLKGLYAVSEALVELNYDRIQGFDTLGSFPAILGFNGPAFKALNISSFPSTSYDYIEAHVGVLSGLYGLLRPWDEIKPYRLEMGSTLKGLALSSYWKSLVTDEIAQRVALMDGTRHWILNLASVEYFSSVDTRSLDIPILNVIFKDDGKVKSVYAKKARGLFCRYVLEERISTRDGLEGFHADGYVYCAEDSDANHLVYHRTSKRKR